MSHEAALERLGELLELDAAALAAAAIEIPGVGVFAAEPRRGGRSYLVGFDVGYLRAAPGQRLDQIIGAYRGGDRSVS